ncbi:MAG TPA: hypothetical protein VJC18_05030, partial [bacterium]|nr:hypothetical protein [bacterium]
LVGVSGADVYSILPESIIKIESLSDNNGVDGIVVDSRDDSIYTSQWQDNSFIRHYDSAFNLIETVIAADYCLNMALDEDNNLLYYTDSVANTISSVNLVTDEVGIVRENIGNGAASNNIGVAVDDDGNLYYSNFYADLEDNKGLFKYNPSLPDGERETKIMDIAYGVGNIYWWSAGEVVIQTNVIVGSLIVMDEGQTEGEPLEHNVNTSALVATSAGVVYLYSADQMLKKVDDGEIQVIGDPLGSGVLTMALDHNDDLFLPIDRFLHRVNLENGMTTQWLAFEDGNMIVRIEYDFKNNEMVVMTESTLAGDEAISIWRTATELGSTPIRVAEIALEDNDFSAMVVDQETGKVYFYNRLLNELMFVDENDGSVETVLENVIEDDIEAPAGLNFLSSENSLLITYLDRGRYLLPLDGSGPSLFCEMAYGMDNQQGYVDGRGYYYGTNSGVIYRIRPE